MATLLSRTYTKEELLKYAGNISQIAGVRQSRLENGRADGMSAFDIKTGSGLELTLLPARCLDIAALSYKGINLSFLAKNGLSAPAYTAPFEREFAHYMNGGMMFTCGLRNTGAANRDTLGEFHPLHGRIGITPAENAYGRGFWDGDEYLLEAGGMMRESFLFGVNLTLTRRITTKLGSNDIYINDTLENLDSEPSPMLLLYHFNLGFPFLDAELRTIFPDCETTARTEEAFAGISEREIMTKPVDNFFEHCFFRSPKECEACVAAENPRLGIGIKICYETENLPVLTEWKSMRSGDYALGLEPGNSLLRGNAGEYEAGALPMLEGFGKREFRLRLSVYDL